VAALALECRSPLSGHQESLPTPNDQKPAVDSGYSHEQKKLGWFRGQSFRLYTFMTDNETGSLAEAYYTSQ